MSAVRHYLLFGGFEGRNPSTEFDTSFYLSAYEDVNASGINPLIHFLAFGESEGRYTQRAGINEHTCPSTTKRSTQS
jgi:hypothetical protein